MKSSSLYSVLGGLALGAMIVQGTALGEKTTPFTATETDKTQNFPWLMDASFTQFYMLGGSATFDMESEEARVAGSGSYTIDAIVDATGAMTLWGEFHVENTEAAWDGYYTGTQDGFTATCLGKKACAGLVSRWQWTPTSDGNGIYHWRGYIVENGPGEAPLKLSGWRMEQFEPLKVVDGIPLHIKASLATGGGQASHVGVYTDVSKIGLVDLPNGTFSATGAMKAANGDLLRWVTFGVMTGPPAVEVFLVGGTGRFEHAVGSFAGPLQYQSPTLDSYTCKAIGTIRY